MYLKAVESIVWTKQENHRLIFDKLATTHNIKESSDWYKVTKEDLNKEGGKNLLQKYYDNSLYKVLFIFFDLIGLAKEGNFIDIFFFLGINLLVSFTQSTSLEI